MCALGEGVYILSVCFEFGLINGKNTTVIKM